MGLLDLLFKRSKNKLRNEFAAPLPTSLPAPLGLRIGASVEFDLLPIRMHQDSFRFALPIADQPMIVAAQGRFELDEGVRIHRFYSEESTMLQLLTRGSGELANVEEITLYVPYECFYPDGEAQWSRWSGLNGRIGAPEFRLTDGTTYTRIWFDNEPGWVRPVRYTETVHDEPDPRSASRRIVQEAMLYGRHITDSERAEYLLVAREETDGEASVSLMVGIDLDRSAMKIL